MTLPANGLSYDRRRDCARRGPAPVLDERAPDASPAEMDLADNAMLLMWMLVIKADGAERLLPVLRLIALNVTDVDASVHALAKLNVSKLSAARRLYELHRNALLDFFARFIPHVRGKDCRSYQQSYQHREKIKEFSL